MVSVLDNKETFEQFLNDSKENKGSPEHRKNYFLTKGRRINLTLANKLKNSKHYDDSEILKTCRRLFFCSSLNLIKSDWLGTVENVKTSNRCKSPHCAICRRARSGKLAARLRAAIQDENNSEIFKDQKFYFLTLTMKHDESTRNYNYLQEFKEASKKLRRSTIYKKNFTGALTSIENVISDTYHIHSHSLLTGNIKGKVNELQDKLSSKWLKITGDSFMLSLDLIKTNNLHKAIIEVVKYSTKIMKLEELQGTKLDKLAEWIKGTKGQNFVNVTGKFRGLELTGNKSKYDSERELTTIEESDTVILTTTSKQKFNFNPQRNYTKKGKEARDKYLYLKDVDKESLILTGENSIFLMSEIAHDFNNEDLQTIKDSLQDLEYDFYNEDNNVSHETCPF